MIKRPGCLILSVVAGLFIGGCGHVISKETRESALKDLTPESILRDFERYEGKLVLMGGEIIETRNLEEETLIEVLQKPLTRGTGEPLKEKDGNGRFLVKYNSFKDPYVFGQGRGITVAGVVATRSVLKIGEKAYTYVVLENRETHLWPEPEQYYGYPYPPTWYPYYPYRPWRYPYDRRHWH